MINIGIGALILAVWFVTLFIGKSLGLSMLFFIVPFSYFFIYILEKNGKTKNRKAKFLLVPISLLASTYCIYNNAFFGTVNLIAIPSLLILMILLLIGEDLRINQELFEMFFGFVFNPIEFIGEGIEKLRERKEEKYDDNLGRNKPQSDKYKRISKALIISLPIIIVVLVLLSTADEIFANIFKKLFQGLKPLENIDFPLLIVRIIVSALLFLYFIGLFYYYCFKHELKHKENVIMEKINDNFAIRITLTSLNIIYIVFCYIQIKSLFLRNTTLNYANYARQGFFQLMAVSFINLVTILIAKKRENKDEHKTNSLINFMSILMIVFTFIIVISAGVRMHFYESAYGYTLLRLLVYCALFTETILFIPTSLYILDIKVNLIKAYSIIIISVYICMNFMNFDYIIAKRNVDRFIETGKIDLFYLKIDTGTDAVNQIVRILNEKNAPEDIKRDAKRYLMGIYKALDEEKMDFRNFNISKIQAKKTINKDAPDVIKEIEIERVKDECMW